MTRSLLAALLLGTAATIAGPIACSTVASQAGADEQLGISKSWMDTSVRPGEDFYAYANGAWMRDTQIPADRSSTGSFLIASNETESQLSSLIQDILASDPEPGTAEARVKALYTGYLDTAAIEEAGLRPILPELREYAAITDRAELSRALGAQVRADVDPLNYTDFVTENLFGVFVTQALQGSEVVPYILQGGLGMPEREYYLSDDPEMAKARAAYLRYIEDILDAAEMEDASAKARGIFDLETKIARAHATRVQSNDFARSANLWSRAQLEANAPGIDWDAFLKAARLDGQDKFAAYHPDAIAGLSSLVASEPLEVWKDWLAFRLISGNADVLPARFDALHFGFYGTTLSGTPEQRPRDKRALAAVSKLLGDDVGQLYAARYFPASAKSEIEGIVGNIKDAFAERVRAIDWMAPGTKAEALKKVETIRIGVGYSEEWRDFSGLEIPADNPVAARAAALEAEYLHQLSKIGKPLDRSEWWMTPQTVNAMNLPVQNALNFPAAILQPPFFDPEADPAFNYGAIGAVIGHEISHSFDNNGAEFDSSGRLRNWWTDADRARFASAGEALARQYDAYAPFPDLHVNGQLTLGENIADVAGLAAAYDAYRASLDGGEAPVLGGLTGDQRFFIAFAQTWATKMREPQLRQRIATDVHAPGMYRALTVRNLDAWYEAFDVRPDDKLYLPPDQRVRVW